jgi:allantoinase
MRRSGRVHPPREGESLEPPLEVARDERHRGEEFSLKKILYLVFRAVRNYCAVVGAGGLIYMSYSLLPVTCDAAAAVHFAERVVLEGHAEALPAMLVVGSNGILTAARASTRAEAQQVAASAQLPFHDHGTRTISPGLIDVHVHISALGDRGWEGFASATAAAAAGGVTAVIGMPLNSIPPTTNPEALEAEVAQARTEGLHVDVGFWGGVIPSSLAASDLPRLLADERILGIKAFLSHLPPAAGYAAVSPAELADAAAVLVAHAKIEGGAASTRAVPHSLPLLVHCELFSEDDSASRFAAAVALHANHSFGTFAQTRPPSFERAAIAALLDVVRAQPALRAHIVHLSDAGSLALLRTAKATFASGGRLTVETCPHYLHFAAEDVPDGETRLKCLPPLRERPNCAKLWDGLATGVIDMVASDHSPCLPSMRFFAEGDFLSAWAGISGLQFSLPATWTGARRRHHSVVDLAKWWSEQPARLCGQWERKGSLRAGKDADFVVWEPEAVAVTDQVYHRHAGSIFASRTDLRGLVRRTYLRGREVFALSDETGSGLHGNQCGRILTRRPATRASNQSGLRS